MMAQMLCKRGLTACPRNFLGHGWLMRHATITRHATSMASMTTNPSTKQEGDISSIFASLSGKETSPLPDRFRELKLRLVKGHENAVIASWKRLLAVLQKETEAIALYGPSIIPEVRFSHLSEDLAAKKQAIEKRGAAVIRGVIREDQARTYKFEIEEYIRQNPHTKGFPSSNPQVWELYWSPSQIRARAHPSLLATQTALMTTLWHSSNRSAPISFRVPLTYCDRLRIRQPGDARFALGPHQDGGSVERWEEDGYGRGKVYDAVFRGEWDHPERGYDPYDAAGRIHAVTDLYGGPGACSMFRAFQGWLAMSELRPWEGTLMVVPIVKEAEVYVLLRPFFKAVKSLEEVGRNKYLDEDNWEFTGGEKMGSELHGSVPGLCQELSDELHPHLRLDKSLVNIPEVKPGDYVVWHCDVIHAVDKKHNGASDSSVLYIPVCPTTEGNARYVARQLEALRQGTPSPDFPGGEGESRHVARGTVEYAQKCCDTLGLQAMGLNKLVPVQGDSPGGAEAVRRANEVLGWQ